MKRVYPIPPLIRWLFLTGLIFITLLTVFRLAFYLFFNKQGYTFSGITDALFLGFRFDLRAISVLLLIILLLGSIPVLHPFQSAVGKKLSFTILALAIIVMVFFYIVDFAHYSYLSQRLNASVLNYLQDLGISINMVWQSYPVGWFLLALIGSSLLIFFAISGIYKWISRQKLPVTNKKGKFFFFASFILLGLLVFGKLGQYPLRWSDAFSLGSDYKANLALNPFESFINTLKFRERRVSIKEVSRYSHVLRSYYPLTLSDTFSFSRLIQPASTAFSRKPNVILIICESFSAYKSSMWGNPLKTTPFFDSLSRQGIFFDRCFTPTYGTARGIWATVTGIPDVEIKSTASRNPGAVDQHTILDDFIGYEKYYFLGGSSSWANIRGFLTNNIHGLKLYEQEDFKAPKLDVWGISDKNLLLESAEILNKESKPFFAIIQTADNHRPYSIPTEDMDEFKKITVPEDTLIKYGFESEAEMNAFRYTDFSFRKFMDVARSKSYFDNTLFVFIGDHGISGNANSLFPEAWTRQRLSALHVPLLFFGGPVETVLRSGKIASQVDVLPTIAGLCRIPYLNTTLGRDLLVSSNRDFAFIFDPDMKQYGVVRGEYLFRKNMETSQTELVPIVKSPGVISPEKRLQTESELKDLSEAIYLASRYLLLNNQKKRFRHQ